MKKIIYCIILSLAPITHAREEPAGALFDGDVGENKGHFSSRIVHGIPTPISVLVMHHTMKNLHDTIEIFRRQEPPCVSAHYIISEEGTILRNTQEENAAHQAGDSYWNGVTGRSDENNTWNLNMHSLGIEHVNLGYKVEPEQPEGTKVTGSDLEWYPFTDEQINASIKLCKDILKRYGIEPANIVGHSDIAPKRKQDPGPLFPWHTLYQNGIGAWPADEKPQNAECLENALKSNTLQEWLTAHLHLWGYKLPDEQATATDINQAFQMHFRPNDISGNADQETAEILNALLHRYKSNKDGSCPCIKK